MNQAKQGSKEVVREQERQREWFMSRQDPADCFQRLKGASDAGTWRACVVHACVVGGSGWALTGKQQGSL